MRAVHVRISGRVQGVAYRAWSERTALRLGLSGWVRNLRDGRVEAVFAGDEAAVEDMLRLARRGPPAAQVTGIEVDEVSPPPQPGFAVLPTA